MSHTSTDNFRLAELYASEKIQLIYKISENGYGWLMFIILILIISLLVCVPPVSFRHLLLHYALTLQMYWDGLLPASHVEHV